MTKQTSDPLWEEGYYNFLVEIRMKSPLFIIMSVTAIVLVGALCLLSYGGYESLYQRSERKQLRQHHQIIRTTPPIENVDESKPLPSEMT